MKENFKLEVCCADIESVGAAQEGGADRIELCTALETGGVTPSAGLLEKAIELFGREIMVLVRERTGDFVYSAEEINAMCSDIRHAVKQGVKGIVIGALTPRGDVDEEACRRMLEAARGAETTFHRAFDLCRNPVESIETIIRLGFNRILTSGCRPTAWEGRDLLKQLNNLADNRIIILPGSGVNAGNVAGLLEFTTCHEVHASAKVSLDNCGDFTVAETLGLYGRTRHATSAQAVKELKSILSSL